MEHSSEFLPVVWTGSDVCGALEGVHIFSLVDLEGLRIELWHLQAEGVF